MLEYKIHTLIYRVEYVFRKTKHAHGNMERRSKMRNYRTLVLILFVMSFMWGCSSSSGGSHTDTTYNPVIDPANFVTGVDNQYMPLVPGQTFHYLNTTTEGTTQLSKTLHLPPHMTPRLSLA